jgi:hypothetical protein
MRCDEPVGGITVVPCRSNRLPTCGIRGTAAPDQTGVQGRVRLQIHDLEMILGSDRFLNVLNGDDFLRYPASPWETNVLASIETMHRKMGLLEFIIVADFQ